MGKENERLWAESINEKTMFTLAQIRDAFMRHGHEDLRREQWNAVVDELLAELPHINVDHVRAYLDGRVDRGIVKKTVDRNSSEPAQEIADGCVCWTVGRDGIPVKTALAACPLHGSTVRAHAEQVRADLSQTERDALYEQLDAVQRRLDRLEAIPATVHAERRAHRPDDDDDYDYLHTPAKRSRPDDAVNHPDFEFWRTQLDAIAPKTVRTRDLFLADAAHVLTVLWKAAERR